MEFIQSSLVGDANLKAYYRFESGALTTDSSGNSKTLTTTGTVTSVAGGKFNNTASATFNISNYLQSTPLASAIATGDVSFGCWFKKNGAPSVAQGTVLATGDFGGTNERFYLNVQVTTGYLEVYAFDGTNNPGNISNDNACDNVWHLVVYTRTGNVQKGYLDGAEVASVDSTLGDVAGTKFNIGVGVTGEECEAALIDDAFILDRLLSPTEIAALYAEGGNLLAFF